MTSNPPSGASTPRFISQNATAEDLLKTQTVGLVNLADFRKRRADALEQKEREAAGYESGSRTPVPVVEEDGDGALTPRSDGPPVFKKKKKDNKSKKGLLSFDRDEEDDDEINASKNGSSVSKKIDAKSSTDGTSEPSFVPKKKFTPNPNSVLPAPKALTKAALNAEAAERERLRKEFVVVQEKVRNAEISIPFVFHDGNDIPGGTVKVKKGDHIWLLLERCRKVGAELGVSGSSGNSTGSKSVDSSKKQWARIGVDDLMCVRGEIIVPHHYEFYYFIANKIQDPTKQGQLLFDYAGTVSQEEDEKEEVPLLRVPGTEKLEGHDDDPSYTKVVDRRWYERNKHIYPASLWKEYKAGKEFEELARARKDALGNSFFFS